MLDSSAAFDTVDQSLLLHKLKNHFNINEGALKMITSYFSNRKFSVKINKTLSSPRNLTHGVPQGSLLGPLFYILYTKEVETITSHHGLTIQCYADDCQLYISFYLSEIYSVEEKISTCLHEIKKWMNQNFLKLNSNKTQIKILKNKSVTIPSFRLLTEVSVESVKVLGVLFDENLKFTDFISKKVKACNFQLRNLYNIRESLNTSTRIMMVSCLLLSTIDFCNVLLVGATDKELRPIKLIINRAIRFIFSLTPRTHITPFYKKVHFLPIRLRIKFKACLIAHKIFYGEAPEYFNNDFKKYVPTTNKNLREGCGRDKFMFLVITEDMSSKRLSILIKREWNILPLSLRTCDKRDLFKSRLKAHFFSQF